jgi:hypothetical protein
MARDKKKKRQLDIREQCEYRKEPLWNSQERQHFLNRSRDIVDYLLPHAGPVMGERDGKHADARWKNIFDTTATEALRISTAGLMTYAFPQGGEWRTLKLRGQTDSSTETKEWLSKTDDGMEDVFEQANVYQGIAMLARDTKAFGQGVAIVDYDPLYTLWLYHIPIGDYALAASYRGQIDTLYRELVMPLRAVVKRWGKEALSTQLRQRWEKDKSKCWETPVTIVQAIEPRPEEYQQSEEGKQRKDPVLNTEMPWRSVYWERDTGKHEGLLSESGYDVFPVLAPREDVMPGCVYGYGSGCMALAHIRSLQHRHFRLGTLIDWQSDPAAVLPTRMQGQYFGPGSRIYSDSGAAGIETVTAAGKADLLLADIQDVRRQIRSTMGADVFSMISSLEGGNIRQEHILALKEEKFTILGPQTARFMDELPRPLVDIAFSNMQRHGSVPPMPADLEQSGGIIDIELHGPIARASASAKKLANDSFAFGVAGLAETFPSMRHKVKEFAIADVLHETSGADPSTLRSDEEAQVIADAEAAMRAKADAIAMGGAVAKGLSDAGSVSTTEPNLATQALGVDAA